MTEIEFKRGDKVRVVRSYGPRLESVFKVLATADGYAMVRAPRAVPFVAALKELRPAGSPSKGGS